MPEDKYHVPWQDFVASLTLLQVPVHLIWAPTGVVVRVGEVHEEQARTALAACRLFRMKRFPHPNSLSIDYVIPWQRFADMPPGMNIMHINVP